MQNYSAFQRNLHYTIVKGSHGTDEFGNGFSARDRFQRSTFVSRGVTDFEIFRRASPPVESVIGESRVLGRRSSQTTLFATAELSVPVSVKSARGQNDCPDSGSGLVPRLSG